MLGVLRRFEGRFAAQYFERIVRHAVALKNDVFHFVVRLK